MKMIYALAGLFALLLVAGCVSTPETTTTTTIETTVTTTMPTTTTIAAGYIDLSPEEAKELIETQDVIIIDVSPHYANGHIPGAVSYYLGDGSLDQAISSLDKDATYLVYCHIDSVAIAGAQRLVDAGFTTVYRLEGNYAAWVDAGYDVEV